MGAKLCKHAVLYALPTLGNDHVARVILMTMATHAMDSDTYPRYFAGSAHLARALGYSMDDPSGERAVRRGIRRLRESGLITQAEDQPRRHKRTWLLCLPGP